MFGLDSLLLLLFVTITIMNNEWLGWGRIGYQTSPELIPLLLVAATIVYLLVDITLQFVKKNRILNTAKISLFSIVILTLVGFPLLNIIYQRHTSVNYLLIHDGALQTEIAARFLFKGINPYSANYLGTPMESWRYFEEDHPQSNNPALYHYAYFPLFLITSTAGHAIQNVVLGWEDLRFTLFVEYIAMLVVVWLLVRNMKEKYLFLILFGANPIVVHFLLEGRNDTASFLYLISSAYFLSRQKLTLSAIFLAFAISFKQTLWFAVPFFLGYVFFKKSLQRNFRKYTIVFLLISTLIIGPFFLWDPKSFYDSTIQFMNGGTKHVFPIKGIGFSQILHVIGFLPNTHMYFPFWIFQFIAVIPLLFFLLKKLKQNPRISHVFLFFSITTLVFFYFSRGFSDSYIVTIFLAFITSMVFYLQEKNETETT